MTRFTLQLDEQDIIDIKKKALEENMSPSKLLLKAFNDYKFHDKKKAK